MEICFGLLLLVQVHVFLQELGNPMQNNLWILPAWLCLNLRTLQETLFVPSTN